MDSSGLIFRDITSRFPNGAQWHSRWVCTTSSSIACRNPLWQNCVICAATGTNANFN